jgi:acyl dehydratase
MALGGDVVTTISFPTPPRPNLLKAALHRPRIPSPLVIPRIEVEIERAELIDDPRYRSLCGFASEKPPITAPHLLASAAHIAIVAHRSMPLPAMGLVHTRNLITAHQPLEAGMPLCLQVYTEGHRHVRAGVEFDVHTAAILDGAVVWEEVSTYLSRAVQGSGDARQPEPPPLRQLVISTHWRLPADLGRRYGWISGDMNPIHMTAASARLFGFSRAIIHGMWTLGRSAAQLQFESPGRLTCTFRRPAMLPSSVYFHAGDDGCFEVRSVKHNKLILEGMASQGLSRRS